MSFRYIGSKARVVEAILEHIGQPDGGVFVDAFCGTGAVGRAASQCGWPVHVNDHLASSAIQSIARIISSKEANFEKLGGYIKAINLLNDTRPLEGFIWREYSPASSQHCPVSRMYFTEENAQKIDSIRRAISEWKHTGLINDSEEQVLIADLIGATNRIANTAGTYGCFLSRWQRQSLNPIAMIPREFPNGSPVASMSMVDIMDLECGPKDTVYLDPPYTKRQYAAYYHILETITHADEPIVKGVGGIRPWQEKASDFCYKVRAAAALEKLVNRLPARRIFLSYSTEGHVPLNTLLEVLSSTGKVVLCELDQVGRYRPNRAASEAGSEVGEVLFFIDKTNQTNKVAA